MSSTPLPPRLLPIGRLARQQPQRAGPASPLVDGGMLSPATDAGYASSEDGDTLQTPLTEAGVSFPALAHCHYRPAPGAHHKSLSPVDPFYALPPAHGAHHIHHQQGLFAPMSSSSPQRAPGAPNLSTEYDPFDVSPVEFNTQIWGALPEDDDVAPTLPPITLPSLMIQLDEDAPSRALLFDTSCDMASIPPSPCPSSPELAYTTDGRAYSLRFMAGHQLNPYFVGSYALGDELGAGGYGFVMTARNRDQGHEVAVKFIIKDKVPDHAWIDDDLFGRLPTEVMLVSVLDHENIVKCLEVFEDEMYFYLVQELHGTPWINPKAVPALSPASSYSALDSAPHTPEQAFFPPLPRTADVSGGEDTFMCTAADAKLVHASDAFLLPTLAPPAPTRPTFARRASHDLFECIEQSAQKRLPEPQAKYVFAQVVEAVHYLEARGISHRDIKDENLVIDSDLKVKLIDFGSAVVSNPHEARPYYHLFFGTTAYAAPEILTRQPYRAPPAEVWTLGVLLSYLLTGASPFPTEHDAVAGRIVLKAPRRGADGCPSDAALDLLARCLVVDPDERADIEEVREHLWLRGAL